MEAIITSISVVVAVIIALVGGKFLPMVLPRISHILDRKPFNCQPCTTFHLTWVLLALVAYWKHSARLLLMSVVIAFIVFIVVRKLDRNKIID